MATKLRALKSIKYRGVRYKPGAIFTVKDKDVLILTHVKLAENIIAVAGPEGAFIAGKVEPTPVEVKHAEEVKEEKVEETAPVVGTENTTPESGTDQEKYWDKTKPELRSVCDDLGIDYKTNDTKGYLIEKICNALRYHRRDMRAED